MLPQLIPSPLSIGYAGGSLVSTNDYLILKGDQLFTLVPTRELQNEAFVAAKGRTTFDRGNRGHTLGFTVARQFSNPFDAIVDQLSRTINLPDGGADLSLQLVSGDSLTFKSATISAAPSKVIGEWDSAMPCLWLSIFDFTIVGGLLTGVLNVKWTGDGTVTNTILTQDEDGTVAKNEDGSIVQTNP